jgi:O-methyltransferase involved in polyketide biosynthesis
MTDSKEIKLGSVQETMLLPLWGRAKETQKQNPLLVDNKAVFIINSLPYDFTTISKNIRKLTSVMSILV